MTRPPTANPARAWAWVEHLRRGGTTEWHDFHDEADSQGPLLPGAIQLEVVRRLNLVGGHDNLRHLALVDRILESSAPGRGQPDLELIGAANPTGFGPVHVDPATLPAGELVRMAIGVLAELVVDRDPGPIEPPRSPRAMPWRKGFRLVGNPLVAEHTREALARAGRVSGRRSPVAVILADDLGRMLFDLWNWRVQNTVNASWPWWVGHWARRDELPPNVDLTGVAERWAGRVGAGNVHLVVGPQPGREVARIIGSHKLHEHHKHADHADHADASYDTSYNGLSPEAVQVVRNVNVVLRVLVNPDRHQHLLDHVLLPWLADEQGSRWAVPPLHRDWVRQRAIRMCEELSAAGYPVHGDLGTLIPAETEADTGSEIKVDTGSDTESEIKVDTGPTEAGVLEVALRALLHAKEGQ